MILIQENTKAIFVEYLKENTEETNAEASLVSPDFTNVFIVWYNIYVAVKRNKKGGQAHAK